MSSAYISVAPIADSSPGFSFGRQGACSANTYLQVDGVPSNQAGRLVPFTTAELSSVFIACQDVATFTIEVQTRNGATFTTVYTASISGTRKFTETNITNVEFTQGDELCVKIGSGSTSNVIVGLVVRGSPL